MDDVPDYEERLEGNHYFVIFNIIPNEHQKFLGSHDEFSPEAIVALLDVNIAMLALFVEFGAQVPRRGGDGYAGTLSQAVNVSTRAPNDPADRACLIKVP
jgi:hypothetical protein